MKPRILILISLLFLASCSINPASQNILEAHINGDFEDQEGITFLVSRMYLSPTWGFHVSKDKYIYYDVRGPKKINTYEVSIPNCPDLKPAINELMKAVSKSSNALAGTETLENAWGPVTDGYYYRLDIYSESALGGISLRAQSGASESLPWVDAAINAAEISEKCKNG